MKVTPNTMMYNQVMKLMLFYGYIFLFEAKVEFIPQSAFGMSQDW